MTSCRDGGAFTNHSTSIFKNAVFPHPPLRSSHRFTIRSTSGVIGKVTVFRFFVGLSPDLRFAMPSTLYQC